MKINETNEELAFGRADVVPLILKLVAAAQPSCSHLASGRSFEALVVPPKAPPGSGRQSKLVTSGYEYDMNGIQSALRPLLSS